MKIEFDLPDFEKELKVEITIRRDGEVVYQESSETLPEEIAVKPVAKRTAAKSKSKTAEDLETVETRNHGDKISGRGNMMNFEEL